MSVPGCAGYMPGDEWPNIGNLIPDESDSIQEQVDKINRIVALESLYSAMKEATQSPHGYTPKVWEAMKRLKALEGE